ncbi:rRNA-binding ribosome biosynthesis protein utp25 [Xylographa trunciseda]|nr:rRNA-binding ribosome biosynthesis protein utp25 [Xylographa trunciseda]
MAPFRRGTKGGGGSSSRGRGGPTSRGRGRGRGRGSSTLADGPKSTFYSTRVEEAREGISEHDQAAAEESVSEEISPSESSEDGADATAASIVKPYNILLRSLNRNVHHEQPPHKRRRLVQGHAGDGPLYSPAPTNILQPDEGKDPDFVEEAEEAGNISADGLDDDDIFEPEDDDSHDYFHKHFTAVDEKALVLCTKDTADLSWITRRSVVQPVWKLSSASYKSLSIVPELTTKTMFTTKDFQLKHRLQTRAKQAIPSMNGLNGILASSIFKYQDLLFCDRLPTVASDIRTLTCLHALNHIFKTRDRIIKNNTRLLKADTSEDVEYRDQGFTRPKVLIVLPTRQACVKAAECIISLCEPEQQENKKRFQDSYSQADDDFSPDKPEDFRELFGGNDDDMFRLGMKFTRKTVKFFSQFYNSDMILASPLGLRMAIGNEDMKKEDHDFLSSIEIVIVDQTDALLMQNWEHLEYIFDHLNLQPKETHGCDFSRVRNWYLDGYARFLRQTIILSAYNTPEINRLFGHNMLNIAGKVKICKDNYEGVMLDLGMQVKQTFSRYDAPNILADSDARFKYFITAIIPSLSKIFRVGSTKGQGILIFIPSYMDFVRIRNFFANSASTQNVSFGSISEYTSVRDVARARSHFFSGRHSLLLYTGRAHHFRRYLLRGVQKVIMYALPDNPLFYQEIVEGYLTRSLSEGSIDALDASVRSVFSKWDILKLERIVGTKRCATMIEERNGDTFDFV